MWWLHWPFCAFQEKRQISLQITFNISVFPFWFFLLNPLDEEWFSYNQHNQQENIPIGCVPSSAVAVGGGVVCPGVSARRRCLPGGGVCPEEVPARGCLPGRGVSAQGGVSQHALRQTPPPVDRILDTHLWKYYLAATSLQTVIRSHV